MCVHILPPTFCVFAVQDLSIKDKERYAVQFKQVPESVREAAAAAQKAAKETKQQGKAKKQTASQAGKRAREELPEPSDSPGIKMPIALPASNKDAAGIPPVATVKPTGDSPSQGLDEAAVKDHRTSPNVTRLPKKARKQQAQVSGSSKSARAAAAKARKGIGHAAAVESGRLQANTMQEDDSDESDREVR